jgi:hypothetical protein
LLIIFTQLRILPILNKSTRMTSRRLITAVAASLSLSLGALAVIFGIADLASVSANVWMRDWEDQGYMRDPAQWDDAYGRLSLARGLNPLSADYSADLGRLMDWQSLHQSPGSAEYSAYRAHAGQFHAEAIVKRPSWGYAWAHYAENQLLVGNRGDEFLLALEKAIVLAPWEPGVQIKTAWIGMATWDDLPNHMRVLVEENIRRTVETDRNLIDAVRLAIQYDWLDQLTPMMRTERQVAVLEYILQQVERR